MVSREYILALARYVKIPGTPMTDQKRPYKMKRRAELERATRERITESAIHLHGTLGPARTSMGAVASHAGVRRSTVYRHFPDEMALFQACSAHWRAANPLPDLASWAAIEDADERLRLALRELYAFYRSSRGMLENLYRDEALSAPVASLFGRYRDYLEAARTALMAKRGVRGGARRRVSAAIGHALAFATWRSLAIDQELDDDEVVELMQSLIATAA
jgi:AcrR family transcriptional regulator